MDRWGVVYIVVLIYTVVLEMSVYTVGADVESQGLLRGRTRADACDVWIPSKRHKKSSLAAFATPPATSS